MKLAAVLGGSRSVWEDLEALKALREPDVILATNDAGAHYTGEVHHWVSLHFEKMPIWAKERAERGLPPAQHYFYHESATERGGLPLPYDRLVDAGGSSGLFAVQAGLTLGLTRIVLCGVPMDAEDGHFFDHKRWEFASRYQQGWTRRKAEIAPFVRSMSGWTARLLGRPDEVWLNNEGAEADGPQSSTRKY